MAVARVGATAMGSTCSRASQSTLDFVASERRNALEAMGVDPQRAVLTPGKMSHLRRVLHKCLTDNGPRKPDVKIMVLGGSMTLGNMNCMGDCAKRGLTRPKSAWPRLLEPRLARALPGCTFRVHSRAIAANGIGSVFQSYDLGGNEDLIIEDFSVNDVRGKRMIDGKANDSAVVHKHLSGHEYLTLRLRARNASLILMEAWPAFRSGGLPNSAIHCQAHTEYVHRTVADFYALPILSFMRAVCNDRATASESETPALAHWLAGCNSLDAPGMQCEAHPGPHTHLIYADIIALYLFRQAAAACASSSASGADDDDEPPPHSPSSTLVPASDLEQLAGCSRGMQVSMDVSKLGCVRATALFKRDLKASGFRCYEDRPGKPGWIAEAGVTPAAQLELSVRANSKGSLIVSYLRSYAGFGRARIAVDNHWNHSYVLDGHWDETTSQTELAVIPWTRIVPKDVFRCCFGSVHHPKMHRVQLRVEDASRKFKLVSVGAC